MPGRPFAIRHSPQRTGAFTLVEMLVVVSIIVMLIALLLPALVKSRHAAAASVCLANLHQLHAAQQRYTLDHHGRAKPLTHARGDYWHHALGAYFGDADYHRDPDRGQWKTSMKALKCPVVRRDPVAAFGAADIAWRWGGGGQGTYGANLWVFPRYREYDADSRFPRENFYGSFPAVGRPGDVPLFGDSNWVGSWPDSADTVPPSLYWGYAVHETGRFMGRFAIDRHERGVQLAFIDGSAARVTLAGLWRTHWHRSYEEAEVDVP